VQKQFKKKKNLTLHLASATSRVFKASSPSSYVIDRERERKRERKKERNK
jgi:hypothetical protein